MKISEITIENVTSYKERTVFKLDSGLNILIGTNGGGKSNFQKIIAMVLANYFLPQFKYTDDDNTTSIEPIQMWRRRELERHLDKFFGQETESQRIELILQIEDSDIGNIKDISNNLGSLNEAMRYWRKAVEVYSPAKKLDQLRSHRLVKYEIVELYLVKPEEGSSEEAFLNYLQTFFLYQRFSFDVPGLRLATPVFFFSSERTFDRDSVVQLQQATFDQIISIRQSAHKAAVGENTNLLQLGTRHFARLYLAAKETASNTRDSVVGDEFRKMPDVKLLSSYLHQLGYEWSFSTDRDNITLRFTLIRDGDPYLPEKFSSGEKEIVHFLLAMFALNVQDGLIVIDEPELHLHPRWQRIFLNLFRDVADDRRNQFIVATHSPIFVTPETISDVTRITLGRDGSKHIDLANTDIPEMPQLLRMINSQNNERLFFSDRVVLVEGIQDRVVFEALVGAASEALGANQAVEIIEVGGKHNFAGYCAILEGLELPFIVIADQDYLKEVGTQQVKALFKTNPKKMKKSLQDKKAMDATTFVSLLESSIETEDLEELRSFWEHLKERRTKIVDELNETEAEDLSNCLMTLRSQGIFVLKQGEIEDYFPDEYRSFNQVVELVNLENWYRNIVSSSCRRELAEITAAALGYNSESDESSKVVALFT